MKRIADRIAGALAEEVGSRTRWDEPPALYFVYLEGGQPRLRPAGIPDWVWKTGRPPALLALIAAHDGDYGPLLRASAPEGLHGAAFRCEAWVVCDPLAGSPQTAQIRADAEAHRLHMRPDRVEARTMYAVDRAGITYSAMQVRGDDDVRTSVLYPVAGRCDIAGTIPSALDAIVSAQLGVEMPVRRDIWTETR